MRKFYWRVVACNVVGQQQVQPQVAIFEVGGPTIGGSSCLLKSGLDDAGMLLALQNAVLARVHQTVPEATIENLTRID